MTQEEALSVCKFTCPYLNRGFRFRTKAGIKIHAGTCEWRNEYEVDHIAEHRGPIVARQYRIRWKNYAPKYETWLGAKKQSTPRAHDTRLRNCQHTSDAVDVTYVTFLARRPATSKYTKHACTKQSKNKNLKTP